MSCEACSSCQEQGLVAFFRWKNANIKISGCDQHLREVLEALRAVIKAKVQK